jgi:hypothetical protein
MRPPCPKRHLRVCGLVLVAQCLSLSVCSADTAPTLKIEFIEQSKTKATISTLFTLLVAHDTPKTPSARKHANEGVIHTSGTSGAVTELRSL